MASLTLPLKVDMSQVHFTDEQFYLLCMSNPDLMIERDAKAALILTSPVGGDSGRREASYIADLIIWNRQTGLGEVFSSSTMFKLPEGGDRSPDAAWVERSRWQTLTAEQRQKFPPIAPDFVLELRSRTDSLETLQEKMQEYMTSGVQLGLMVNPQNQEIEIYRQGQLREVRSLPTQFSGEAVLPGFMLQIDRFVED
ncbi:MAG: Uma2 family endonuclease [Leptolyngbya sp. UWPOB_LEPTO1]|uniref:Uma2 family endonuclease n=1 Tax=Leptolyngbya sp. UWPOB_LEPTO1 TaxID=2815653 RepID=UPI001AC65795|nr:Uma2 family endonuclease [Leptolyngbya sp. UWPOB_LEPTO1]MBN8561336.1 Uma2 family endonuclease [Leptolyngbya sp. UWPOB_LEPTO1]